MAQLPEAHSKHSETEPVLCLPPSVANKIFWSPPFEDPANAHRLPDGQSSPDNAPTIPILPPAFTFPDGILSEVQATAACAFSRAVQIASVVASDDNDMRNAMSIPQPIISLYYPRDGCHEVIDAMVKSIAREQKADVVVLDSLELALQEFGAWGKGVARAIDILYKVPSADKTPEKDGGKYQHDDAIQRVFNNIVNIQREIPGDLTTFERRIIYMRDFGSIAPSALPLIPYLLLALHTRRIPNFNRGSLLDCENLLQPTVLILGFSKTPDEGSSWYYEENIERISKGFAQGGEALAQLLPSLDDKLFTLKNRTFPASPFSSTFFLPLLTSPKELTTLRLDFAPINDLMSVAVTLSIFPTDSHKDDFLKVEQRMGYNRRQAVLNAWMVICLGRRGAVICDNSLDSIKIDDIGTSTEDEKNSVNLPDVSKPLASLDDLYKRAGILLPEALDRIATIAVGLSSQASVPKVVGQITPATVSRAYQLVIENWQARSDWSKAVIGIQEVEEEQGVEEEQVISEEDGKMNENEKMGDSIIRKVKGANDLNSYEQRLLNCIVDVANLETTFNDVCIPDKIKDSLRTTVSLPLLHPSAFKFGILGRETIGGVLLYGPPGTGKTMVCRALARECGARMLQLKPSDIMDSYVGESEKLVKSVFSLAYRLAPCVIFIDEMDSLFKRTAKEDRQYQRNILNEFLQLMDGLQSAKKNKDCGIVVVGATNRPYELDDAILRRLANRMMVSLPSEEEREQILRIHLRDEKLSEDVNLRNIASKTSYYSGSDLKSLCVSATMASVKDAIGGFNWTPNMPSESNISDGVEMPAVGEETESKIQTRTVTLANFEHALDEIAPSSSAGSHSELQRWHDQFGRKRTSDKSNYVKPQTNGQPELRSYSGGGGGRYSWMQ